jgi:F-box/WD-40 domain protein MET30
MAPNATHTIEAIAEHTPLQTSAATPKQRRLSWRNPANSSDDFTTKPSTLPHAALVHGHDHEGLSERTRHLHGNAEDSEEAQANKSKKIEKMITPYLAQHIPQQYNPLGANGDRQDERPRTANTKFCYRHRPDLLCRRQADEPSMEQLQAVSVLRLLRKWVLTVTGT